ncbi:hypothetical protein KRP22_012134 [Phytophthora ramorum]|nr:GDSL esterase/lipase [Phytophthora ramorum]
MPTSNLLRQDPRYQAPSRDPWNPVKASSSTELSSIRSFIDFVSNPMAFSVRALHCFFALFIIFLHTVRSEASQLPSKPRPVLLLTGDSLTEKATDPGKGGWVTLLQFRYRRSADIIARGLSGYNSKWFLKYAMPAIQEEINCGAYTSPSFVTVWLGSNDAVLWDGSNPELHVPIEDYKENLLQIVDSFQRTAPDASILLITPIHVDDTARIKYAAERNDSRRGLVDHSNANARRYSRACLEAGRALDVPVLDLNVYFNSMPESTRNALLLEDGLHLNADGHKIADEQIRNAIKAQFPALDKAMQEWQLPEASAWAIEDPWKADA